jgi:hypothetical protein
MRRPTIRFFAFVILALLGAPVALHVVLHDLHDHHDEVAVENVEATDHGDHEHPVISSPAPQVPSLTRVALPLAILPAATKATWSIVATIDRNVLSFGALRTDDDVGLQPLLSTFLI